MYSDISKKVICLDSFSKQLYNIWVIFRLISVFETTALLSLPIYSIFLWLLLPDFIGSLMRLFLQLKPRYGPSPAFLMIISLLLKHLNIFILNRQPCNFGKESPSLL